LLRLPASGALSACKVTMLGDWQRFPLERALGPKIGQIYADLHRERGVELRTRRWGRTASQGHRHVTGGW